MSSEPKSYVSGGSSARLMVLGSFVALVCASAALPAQQAIPEIKRAPANSAQSAEIRRNPAATSTSGDAKENAKKAARDAAADNQQTAPQGGPDAAAKTGATPVRTNPGLADGSKTSREDALKAGTSATSGRPTATLTPDNGKRPAFDQGFGEKGKQVSAAAAGGGNPMKAITGGGVGGPLAESAGRSNGVRGINSQGKAGISDGVTSAANAQTNEDGEVVISDADKARAKELEKRTGLKGKAVADTMITGGNKDRAEILKASEDDGTTTAEKPDRVTKSEDGTITHQRSDGSKTVIEKNTRTGTTTITQTDSDGNESKEVLDKNNKLKEQDEESRYKPDKQDYIRNKMADRNYQIVQEAKTGGTVNPDRNDTGGGPAAGAAVPSQSAVGQSMFGNPGQRGGMGESGAGRTGIDFNGSAGAIDPGDEATVTAGNRQQDPGSFFDRGRGQAQGVGNRPGTQSSDDDKKDEEKDEKKDGQTQSTETPR